MYLWGRVAGASIAWSIWRLIFRVVGADCVVDGIYKLGLLPWEPASKDTFQPSPFGPVSNVIEIVAGLLVFIGLRCRTGVLVLGAHLALGNLVLKFRDPAAFPSKEWDVNAILLGLLLIFGPGMFSVDYFWPDAFSRLFRLVSRREAPPVVRKDPGI